MRSQVVALLAAVGSTSARATPDTVCHSRLFVDEIGRHADCGNVDAITHCLMADIDLTSSHRVEACFAAGGCAADDASISALWLAYECDLSATRSISEGVQEDLRLRQLGGVDGLVGRADEDSPEKDAADKTEETTAAAAKTPTQTEATPAATPATTAAATTPSTDATDTKTTAAAETKAAETTSSESSSSSSDSDTSAGITPSAASDNSAGTSIQCSTTDMVTTKICIYPKGTKTCSTKVTPTSKCAEGIICQTDIRGNPTCMHRDNHLTTSGLVVTLIFSIGLLSFLLAVIYMCCKDRRAFKRAEAIRRNALGVYKPEADLPHGNTSSAVAGAFGPGAGKLGKSKGKGNGSEAHLPLMKGSERDLAQSHLSEVEYGRDHSPMPDSSRVPAGGDTGYSRI